MKRRGGGRRRPIHDISRIETSLPSKNNNRKISVCFMARRISQSTPIPILVQMVLASPTSSLSIARSCVCLCVHMGTAEEGPIKLFTDMHHYRKLPPGAFNWCRQCAVCAFAYIKLLVPFFVLRSNLCYKHRIVQCSILVTMPSTYQRPIQLDIEPACASQPTKVVRAHAIVKKSKQKGIVSEAKLAEIWMRRDNQQLLSGCDVHCTSPPTTKHTRRLHVFSMQYSIRRIGPIRRLMLEIDKNNRYTNKNPLALMFYDGFFFVYFVAVSVCCLRPI